MIKTGSIYEVPANASAEADPTGLIKLDDDDKIISAIIAMDDRDTLTVKTSMGGEQRLNTGRYKVTGRGGRGHEFVSRGQIVEVIHQPVPAPKPLEGK